MLLLTLVEKLDLFTRLIKLFANNGSIMAAKCKLSMHFEFYSQGDSSKMFVPQKETSWRFV
jgi:hypothetical protein